MSVGIVGVGKSISAGAGPAGNPVYIFGSATGKDGIHGAAFASKDMSEDSISQKTILPIAIGRKTQSSVFLFPQ